MYESELTVERTVVTNTSFVLLLSSSTNDL